MPNSTVVLIKFNGVHAVVRHQDRWDLHLESWCPWAKRASTLCLISLWIVICACSFILVAKRSHMNQARTVASIRDADPVPQYNMYALYNNTVQDRKTVTFSFHSVPFGRRAARTGTSSVNDHSRFTSADGSAAPRHSLYCPYVTYVEVLKKFRSSWIQVSLFLESTRRFCNSRFVLLRSPNVLLNCCRLW